MGERLRREFSWSPSSPVDPTAPPKSGGVERPLEEHLAGGWEGQGLGGGQQLEPLLPRVQSSCPGMAARHGAPSAPSRAAPGAGRLPAPRGIKAGVDERLFHLGVDTFSSSPEWRGGHFVQMLTEAQARRGNTLAPARGGRSRMRDRPSRTLPWARLRAGLPQTLGPGLARKEPTFHGPGLSCGQREAGTEPRPPCRCSGCAPFTRRARCQCRERTDRPGEPGKASRRRRHA